MAVAAGRGDSTAFGVLGDLGDLIEATGSAVGVVVVAVFASSSANGGTS